MGFIWLGSIVVSILFSLIGCGVSALLTTIIRKSVAFPRYIFPSIALIILVPAAFGVSHGNDINAWVVQGIYYPATIIVFIYWLIAVLMEITNK